MAVGGIKCSRSFASDATYAQLTITLGLRCAGRPFPRQQPTPPSLARFHLVADSACFPHDPLKWAEERSSHRRGSPRSTRSQAKVCTDTVTGRSKASIDATGAFHVSLFTPLAHLPLLPLPLANFTPRPSPTLLPLRFPLLLQCALDIQFCGSSCSSLACVASLCRSRHRKSR